MTTVRFVLAAAILVVAAFISGTCRERSRAAAARQAERALATSFSDAQRKEIGRLIGVNARLMARDSALRAVAERPPTVAVRAAEKAIYASAHVEIGDPIRVDTLPLKGAVPDLPQFPSLPVDVQDALWPGGAYLIRLPHDPRPHIVDTTMYRWSVWADQTITHYKVLVRDTIRPAWAQRDTQLVAYAALLSLRDSTQAVADSQVAIYREALVDKGLGTLRQQRRGTWLYAGALTAGVAANQWLRLDTDPGGYVDSWDSPDKLTHALAGALLAETAHDGLNVPWRWAVPLTCGAAVGFEASQGYLSARDAVAGCGGALGAMLVRRGLDRLVGR